MFTLVGLSPWGEKPQFTQAERQADLGTAVKLSF
jgi:hypothetical protein